MNHLEYFFFLKDQFKFKYHGIDFSKVMIFELNCIAEETSWVFNLGKLRNVIRIALNVDQIKHDDCNEILATFGQQNRKDHREVFDYVTKRLGNSVSVNDLNDCGYKKSFHPLMALKVIISVLFILRNCSISFSKKYTLAAYCVYYCNTIKELEKLNISWVKKYLAMYNSTQMENLITQYMKHKGIPTYSLCEGIYVVEKEKPTIDSVNFTNLTTEHLLTWGKWVNDQFEQEGIAPERMIVCGYPHEVIVSKFEKGRKLKRGLVLLSRSTYHSANVMLLNILSSVKEYEYTLKCHPSSDIQYYKAYAQEKGMHFVEMTKTVNECLNKDEFDFAIAVNTSAYYEALMRGVPALRFTDKSFSLMKGYDDVFETRDEFIETMSRIESLSASDAYQADIDAVLEYVMGVGLDRYKEVMLS